MLLLANAGCAIERDHGGAEARGREHAGRRQAAEQDPPACVGVNPGRTVSVRETGRLVAELDELVE